MDQYTCSVPDCENRWTARGMCDKHYRRAKKTGTLPPRRSLEDRFWEKVNKTSGCWEWTGATRAGYGKFGIGANKTVTAHRLSLELAGTPVPEAKDVDHICGNRACVNPDHLRVTTRKQNLENMTVLRPDNTSGYRGVSPRRGKWTARVNHNGKVYLLGDFATPELANEAAVEKRNELYTHNDRDRV